MKRFPVIFLSGLLVLAAVMLWTSGGSGNTGSGPSSGASASPAVAVRGDASPISDPSSGASSATQAPPTEPGASPAGGDDQPAPPPDDATASPDAAPVIASTPVVPVTQFRTTKTSATADQVASILLGTSTRYDALELVKADAPAILDALGLTDTAAAAPDGKLILAKDAATLTGDLAKHRQRLAFLRAEDVTPAVRALTWEGKALFGVDHVKTADAWPLQAALPQTGGAFDPSKTWTLLAAGDIMLDRGVYETVRVKKKGVDFPFDGGTAEITGHCKDCSPLGWDTPYTKRTGNKGAVRDLIKSADIAMANFENPAPDRWKWHTRNTIFSADPGIIEGIADTGFDFMGLANNHIGDQGRTGVVQTVKNIEKYDLAHAGAGKDLATARTPAIFQMGDTKVAILAYDAIYKPYHATATAAGSAGFNVKDVSADVKKARKAGADVVIVFPHWGIEYRYAPTATQRAQAHAILDAGADMIIGNHAHYATAMEVYDGKPIWYALGNFVFDQTWSEPTMSGITLELTFHGKELAQVRIRPHLILDKSQPNFLDPAGDGKVVLDKVYKGAPGLLPW